MKKEKTSKFKKLTTRIINIREWADVGRIKDGAQFIKTGIKTLFVPSPSTPAESFEAAQKRLKLSADDMVARSRALLRLSILMLILTLILISYAIYHVIFGTFHSALLTLALSFVSASMAFRYHFWYFQIKSRKLGCSIQEWFQEAIMGKKS